MFPMTITLNNAAQLNAVLAAIGHDASAAQTTAAPKAEAPKDKATTAKKQEAPANTQPTAEAAVADAQKSKADDSAKSAKEEAKTESAPTYEDAKKVVLALSAKKGRTALEALLKDFGATKLPDVKPEQYGELIAAANAQLEG